MSMLNALPKLTAADLEALAAPSAPTLSAPGARTRPRGTLGPRPPRPSRRTPAHRAADRAPVTSRRLRRFLNDATLVATAAEAGALPSTRAEFRALFEPQHRTPFTALADDAAFAAMWAPFVDVDEDAQSRMLRATSAPSGIGSDLGSDDGECELGAKANGGPGTGGPTSVCGFTCEDERAVEMLRKVDGRIRYLFKVRTTAVRPIVKQVEDTVVGLEHGESVVLRLPGPLGRMVAHGVAQFHSLGHRSLGVGADRVLVVRGKGRAAQGSARLVDVLS